MSSSVPRKRPVESWPGVVGQDGVKQQLELHLDAARRASRPLEHVLLVGPDGCGKATLAQAIAAQYRTELTTMRLPKAAQAILAQYRTEFTTIKLPMTRSNLYAKLRFFTGGIFFLDGLDRLSKGVQEFLVSLVHSGVVSDRRGRTYEIKNLTVIASATRREKVIDSLDDGFLVRATFSPYSDAERQQILQMILEREKLTLAQADRVQLAAAINVPGEIPRIIKATRELIEAGRQPDSGSILQLAGLEPQSAATTTSQQRRETIPDDVKIFVWRRDGGACVKCGSNIDLEFDHIIPVALGGSNTARNLQVLCEKCNRAKGARLV
jgi:Holliday junction resolvasome RuvABC ATP-dependent DNA helicase subunit